jgi:hypothetical protein
VQGTAHMGRNKTNKDGLYTTRNERATHQILHTLTAYLEVRKLKEKNYSEENVNHIKEKNRSSTRTGDGC